MYEALIRPFRAAALLEERSRRITELEGEVEVTRERLEAAEAAAEAERDAAAAAAEAADVSAKASTGVRLERLGRRPSASLLRRGRAALPTVAHRASLTAPNVRAWLCGT